MNWGKNAPLGWKFAPTNEELMWGFLYPEVDRRGVRGKGPIKSSDEVYKKPPWEFCTDLTAFPGAKHYFFTDLKKKDQNRNDRTVGSYGTWHGSKKYKIPWKNEYNNNNNNNNIQIMGFKRLFKFKENGEGEGEGKEMKTFDWLMHEFTLPQKEINLALCVIQKKKKKKKKKEEKMGSASAGGDPCHAPAPATAPALVSYWRDSAADFRDGVPDLPADDAASVSYWRDSAADFRDGVPDLPADDVPGFRNDLYITLRNDVPPGLPNYVIHDSNTSF